MYWAWMTVETKKESSNTDHKEKEEEEQWEDQKADGQIALKITSKPM